MKPLHWVGPSLRDLRTLPAAAQDKIGHALYLAQMGGRHVDAKPLNGFKGPGLPKVPDVFEYYGDDFSRAVYTVMPANGIYVLHACAHKSGRKNARPSTAPAAPAFDLELVKRRLADAIADAMKVKR